MSMKLLIIGKERNVVDENLMRRYFREDNVSIFVESNKNIALERFQTIDPNIVIIDDHISEYDAIQICKKIKMISTTPIYYLLANHDPDKIISTFDAGMDDCIVKPFQRNILTAKIIAKMIKKHRVLKQKKNSENNKYYKIGHIEINLDGYSVKVDNKEINLIAKELKILLLFIQNPNKVFSADELYNLIWGTESFGDVRTVMVHISNLRKKIERDPSNPQLIQTVRGFGYKFCQPNNERSSVNLSSDYI